MKNNKKNYLINNVDKAYALLIDTDNVELSDESMSFLMRLERDIETFYGMIEEEEWEKLKTPMT